MIEVTNLSKSYGAVPAVRGVSFSVGREQVLGFLGPNGAGKTTVMKALAGCHFPSGGQALIDGLSVEEDPVGAKRRIGYLPENNPLYGDMSPEEYLGFAAASRLIPARERKAAVARALAVCGLEDARARPIGSLSKGYRQRVGLAQAIVHDPPALILDEPTSGLDPNQIIGIRSLIRELGKRKAVILSTHILREVEAVCSSVLILSEGRVAARGTPEEIAGTLRGASPGGRFRDRFREAWELRLKGAADAEGALDSVAALGAEAGEAFAEALEGGVIRLGFSMKGRGDYAADGELIFDWAVSRGYKIVGMTRKTPTLEDIFAELTSRPPACEPLTEEKGDE